MIDIIGIKDYLLKFGTIKNDIIVNYKKAIDDIALENTDYTFVTFTDNIFIKANWKSYSPEYKETYKPEYIISLIKIIQDEIYKVFKLKAYAIVAQGNQLFREVEELKNIVPNHFFIGSLATPFIELFDIENAIKNKIKNNPEFKQNLYLSEDFFASLTLKSYSIDKEQLGKIETLMDNKSGVCMDMFRAISIEELTKLL